MRLFGIPAIQITIFVVDVLNTPNQERKKNEKIYVFRIGIYNCNNNDICSILLIRTT